MHEITGKVQDREEEEEEFEEEEEEGIMGARGGVDQASNPPPYAHKPETHKP